MRASLLISGLIACLLTAAGCRMPTLLNPVSASLASSRKTSQEAIEMLDHGRAGEAETLLARAVKTCPTDQDARRYYAEALWLRGAQAEAVRQMEEATKLAPGDAALRVRLAEMYLATGNIEPAGQTAELALTLNRKLPAAWAIRGCVMKARGDLREALANYHRALDHAPDDRRVLAEVADVQRLLGEPQRALESLLVLAETYPPGEEPGHVLFWLGEAYVAVRRYDDGIDQFNLAMRRDRPTAEMLYHLAEAQWLAGRTSEAAASVQHALALDPRHPGSRLLLGQIEIAQQPGLERR